MCGERLLLPTRWTPFASRTHSQSEPIYVTVSPPPHTSHQIRSFIFYSGISARDFYAQVWKSSSCQYLELRWNSSVIYPGDQTLHDMGFSRDETVHYSPEMVFLFSFFLFSSFPFFFFPFVTFIFFYSFLFLFFFFLAGTITLGRMRDLSANSTSNLQMGSSKSPPPPKARQRLHRQVCCHQSKRVEGQN